MKIPSSQIPQVQNQQAIASASVNMPDKDETPVPAATEMAAEVDETLEPAAVYVKNETKALMYYEIKISGPKSRQDVPVYHGGVQTVWMTDQYLSFDNDGKLKRFNESNLGDFYAQAFEFFRDPNDDDNYWQKRTEYERTLAVAKQELENQIAAGKGDSLDTLTAKVNMHGVEMTLGEIDQLHKIFSKASQKISDTQSICGDLVEQTASMAMVVVSVRKELTDSGLSQEIVGLADNTYTGRMDGMMHNLAASLENSKRRSQARIEARGGSIPSNTSNYYSVREFHPDRTDSFHSSVYNVFKKMDVSSDKAFEDSFQASYSWYKNHMQQWNDLYNGFFKPDQRRTAAQRSAFLLDLKAIFFG